MKLRDLRIVPILLIAAACLAVLKLTGILLDGGYVLLDDHRPAGTSSWAQQTLNFPGSGPAPVKTEPADITGSVDAPKPKAEGLPVSETRPAVVQPPSVSASERAVLERLQERRHELDTRSREVDIRENLLKEAEKRIESKVDEMKGVEARIAAAQQQKEEADNARFKSIVIMYENMKPRDAGKIFDRLEMGVLIEVASRMKPQKMADVLAQMQPDAAEKLTVELARRSGAVAAAAPASALPKIEGRPVNPRN
ncbi:MAG: flagellar protein FlbB [Xanthobacteraceae bacterium]